MRYFFYYSLICVGFLVLFAGCNQEAANRNGSNLKSNSSIEYQPLIHESERHHDFGIVIGRPGQKMSHQYILVNRTLHPVKVVDVFNRRPCCGIVHIGKSILRPGETTDLEVTLLVGDGFGNIVNEIEVMTDLPSEPSLLLRTSATAHPAFRIEEATQSSEAILMGASNTRRAEFRVLAFGTSTNPPVHLNRIDLDSQIKVEWIGPEGESTSDEGLKVLSRRFHATLDSDGQSGLHEAAIALKEGKELLHRHTIHWEVVQPITISPKVVIIKRHMQICKAIVASHDQRAFRITSIDCGTPGIRARVVNPTSALTQIIEFDNFSQSQEKQGLATVFTDHPTQQKVELPFVMID